MTTFFPFVSTTARFLTRRALSPAHVSHGRLLPSRPPITQSISLRQTLQGQSRHQSNYRRPNYSSRRASAASLLRTWASSPRFYRDCGLIGGAGAAFYVYNLEEVPVSGRRRFNWVPESIERQTGASMYQDIMQEYRGRFLSEWDPRYRMVARVLERLVPHSGLDAAHNRWEVHVIDEPDTLNAFVIPGGKVFVFSGILKVCGGDDGVAAVLGHEIAHNVAHHSAEQMSRAIVFAPLALWAFLNAGDAGLSITRLLTDLMFLKPGSRQMESEADYIGLMMMAEACYDPRAAVAMWQRMEARGEAAPPQFLSTHPSNHNRIAKIQEWLDKAEAKREASGCGETQSWMQSFKDTYAQ